MVSHGDIAEGGLNRYPIIYAPSIHGPDSFYPFETNGFRDYLNQVVAIGITSTELLSSRRGV